MKKRAPSIAESSLAPAEATPLLRRRASWPMTHTVAKREMSLYRGGEFMRPGEPSAADARALLPPQPRWRPLPAELEPAAPTLLDAAQQPAQVTDHLQAVERCASAMLPPALHLHSVQWLQVRENRCVGFASVSTNENLFAQPKRVILKQAGSLTAGQPAPLYLQERAWLRNLPPSARSPKLLATDSAASLLMMERVTGAHYPSVLFDAPMRSWVAQALARVHAAPVTNEMRLVRGECRFPWSIERWLPFVDSLHLLPKVTFDRLFCLRNLIVAALDKEPAVRTGIHGDPVPGNILIDRTEKRASLIDFEYASIGDPMFDLAFFAVSIHLPMVDALGLLGQYADGQRQVGLVPHSSDATRLPLYVAYQRLFRHVASHKEYKAGEVNEYDRWLSRLHEDVAYLQTSNILLAVANK